MRSQPRGDGTLTIHQYDWLFARRRRSPEKHLLIAVLETALVDFSEEVRHGRSNARFCELRKWFFDHDQTWPLSFENLCDQLDLDIESIRERLAVLADTMPAPDCNSCSAKARRNGYSRTACR